MIKTVEDPARRPAFRKRNCS